MVRYAIELARYWARHLVKDERGQDLVEYALIAGMAGLVIVTIAAVAFSEAITSFFNGVKGCVDFDSGTACTPGF